MTFEFSAIVLGVFALIIALGTITGWFEDLESEIGSQSNPNSQVQLAPQVGVLHRIFNKAISGEPISHGMYGVTAGTVFTVLWFSFHIHPIIALAAAAAFTTLVHISLAASAHFGRIPSLSIFGQPLYLDVVTTHLPLIAAHGFIVTTSVVSLSYIFYNAFFELEGLIGYPIPIPFLAFLLGLMAGAIGSSTGDVHYGAEREFQHYPFGEGVPTKNFGHITTRGELGWRTSVDVVYFCAKFGGPLSGLCYGLILLLDDLRLLVGSYSTVYVGLIFGVAIIIGLIVVNRYLEVNAWRKFGAYAGGT